VLSVFHYAVSLVWNAITLLFRAANFNNTFNPWVTSELLAAVYDVWFTMWPLASQILYSTYCAACKCTDSFYQSFVWQSSLCMHLLYAFLFFYMELITITAVLHARAVYSKKIECIHLVLTIRWCRCWSPVRCLTVCSWIQFTLHVIHNKHGHCSTVTPAAFSSDLPPLNTCYTFYFHLRYGSLSWACLSRETGPSLLKGTGLNHSAIQTDIITLSCKIVHCTYNGNT
jgi:hypothetical protein